MANDDLRGPRFSLTNIVMLSGTLVTIAVAWGVSQTTMTALAQRMDKSEAHIDDTKKDINTINGSVIELKSEQKNIRSDIERQGHQLDRIEQLVRERNDDKPKGK